MSLQIALVKLSLRLHNIVLPSTLKGSYVQELDSKARVDVLLQRRAFSIVRHKKTVAWNASTREYVYLPSNEIEFVEDHFEKTRESADKQRKK